MAQRSAGPRVAAQEHGPREIVPLEQFGGGATELDLTLLHEDRPVGDGERDLERLLDDDHRLACGLELIDDLEQLLDDGRSEPK